MSEGAAVDAAGVLLNTLVEDTHLEENPEIAPSTAADAKPVTVNTSGAVPIVVPNHDEPHASHLSDPATTSEHGKRQKHVLASGQPVFDLRHEQTYLTAVRKTNMSWTSIARVTFWDFLLVPTVTNSFWIFALDGFKYLRTGSTQSGRKFGQVIRDFLNVGGVLD